MDDLISRGEFAKVIDELIAGACCYDDRSAYEEVARELQKFPAVDAVGITDEYEGKTVKCAWYKKNGTIVEFLPVVRCKDCIHRHSSEFCECRPEDAFCSDGERKEEKKQVPPEATQHLRRRFEQIE